MQCTKDGDNTFALW